MSAQSKSARAALKAKAHRLATEKPGKVDASSYTIPDDMHAEAKTGMRPVSKRAFKRGGKVMGEMAEARADRKPRASGGNAAATPDNLINRNDKSANEERDGVKHVGALKTGGRAKKMGGGPMVDPRAVAAMEMQAANRAGVAPNRFGFTGTKPGILAQQAGLKKGGEVKEGTAKDMSEDKKMASKRGMSMKQWEKSDADKKHDAGCTCKMCSGGRAARASGGRTKSGKTNVNIVIATGAKPQGAPGDMMPPSMATHPAGVPVAVPPPPAGGGMPMGAMPPMGGGMPMPPPGGMPMPRKAGGRTYRSYKDMDAGALGGQGRLEKTEIQAHKR